jgi:hypothetical protein
MARWVDDVRISGKGLSKQLIDAVTTAKMNGSITDVTQIDITFTDPDWKLLRAGYFRLGMSVDIEDYDMEIASIGTGDDETIENVSIKCRPRVVRNLKARRGARVMKNTSPSEFVISECRKVGARYKVQPTARRKQVARDVPKKWQNETSNPPSSWTTFKRLADEVGFLIFEQAGVVYFGKPSWLLSNAGGTLNTYRYGAGTDNNFRTYDVPSCSRSLDSTGQEVKFALRVSYLSTIRPGQRFRLTGVPTFETNYLVSKFDVDMMDSRNLVDVTGVLASNAL